MPGDQSCWVATNEDWPGFQYMLHLKNTAYPQQTARQNSLDNHCARVPKSCFSSIWYSIVAVMTLHLLSSGWLFVCIGTNKFWNSRFLLAGLTHTFVPHARVMDLTLLFKGMRSLHSQPWSIEDKGRSLDLTFLFCLGEKLWSKEAIFGLVPVV